MFVKWPINLESSSAALDEACQGLWWVLECVWPSGVLGAVLGGDECTFSCGRVIKEGSLVSFFFFYVPVIEVFPRVWPVTHRVL